MDEYRYPENFEELVEMLREMTEEECKAILKIMQDNEDHSEDICFANSVAESKKEVTAIQKRLVIGQNKGQL